MANPNQRKAADPRQALIAGLTVVDLATNLVRPDRHRLADQLAESQEQRQEQFRQRGEQLGRALKHDRLRPSENRSRSGG